MEKYDQFDFHQYWRVYKVAHPSGQTAFIFNAYGGYGPGANGQFGWGQGGKVKGDWKDTKATRMGDNYSYVWLRYDTNLHKCYNKASTKWFESNAWKNLDKKMISMAKNAAKKAAADKKAADEKKAAAAKKAAADKKAADEKKAWHLKAMKACAWYLDQWKSWNVYEKEFKKAALEESELVVPGQKVDFKEWHSCIDGHIKVSPASCKFAKSKAHDFRSQGYQLADPKC